MMNLGASCKIAESIMGEATTAIQSSA